MWAGKLGIAVEGIDVHLDGDLDLNGFFGLDPQARPGYRGIQLVVDVTGPESRERYAELAAAVEQHCPVYDNLTAGVPVEVRLAD